MEKAEHVKDQETYDALRREIQEIEREEAKKLERRMRLQAD